jgi:Xaa-Pro aminopeptidase
MGFSQVLHLKLVDDVRDHTNNPLDLYSLVQSFKKNIVFHHSEGSSKNYALDINTNSLSEILSSLRELKTPEEISMLKKAISISVVGQIEVMKAMDAHMSEREIQGIHEFVFRKYGAKHQGYPSIVGAGNHGCVLHYTHNTADPVGDNLVLMDVGASYYGYTADITRTIPANGLFNEQQAAIYNIVLDAQESAISAAVVGVPFSTPGKVARNVIEKGLTDLGIIIEPSEVQRYFPHGTSHYIGLDVHDPGTYGALKSNSVITIEPGIYIPENSPCDPKWWGIAIRIEDDILITNEGPVNLSEAAPKTISEIEQMMQQPSALEDFILPELDL